MFDVSLQLRIEQDGAVGSLIYYNRSNVSGPKQSDYMITIINNPTDLKETLGQALGIKGACLLCMIQKGT